jgi:hypothetical protein
MQTARDTASLDEVNRLRSLAVQAVVCHWGADQGENTLGVTSPAPTRTSPAQNDVKGTRRQVAPLTLLPVDESRGAFVIGNPACWRPMETAER